MSRRTENNFPTTTLTPQLSSSSSSSLQELVPTLMELWGEIWHGVKILVNLKQGVVNASKVLPSCSQIFGWNLQNSLQSWGFTQDSDFLSFLILVNHDEGNYRVLSESELKRDGGVDNHYLISVCNGKQRRFIDSLAGPTPKKNNSVDDVQKVKIAPKSKAAQQDEFFGEEKALSGLSKVIDYIPNPILTPEQQELQYKWRLEQEEIQKRKFKIQNQSQIHQQTKPVVQTMASKIGVNPSSQTSFPTLNESLDSGKKSGYKPGPGSGGLKTPGPKSWNKLF